MTILDKYKNNSIFTFSCVTKEVVLKEIGNLKTGNLKTGILTKIIEQNSDIFGSFICKNFNNIYLFINISSTT